MPKMKKPRYKVILFDMDGTLANTDPMLVATFNDLYDKYRNGHRKSPEEIYYFSGPPIRETLAKEFPELDQQMIFEEFLKVSRSYYDTHTFPYPNCKEVLTELREDNIKLGVVTNKTHALTLVVIDILGLHDYFDVVVGSDDVNRTKPDKEGMLKAINYLQVEKKDTLYVGDNASDLTCADNAGVDCALVYWGPRVLSKDLKPKFRINSYKELLEEIYE